MKLVIFERDWADEFSPYGFAVMTAEELKDFKAQNSKPRDWYFGTNEGFDSEVLLDGCTVKEITHHEAEMITKLFGLKKYDWTYGADAGLFPSRPDDDDEDDDE